MLILSFGRSALFARDGLGDPVVQGRRGRLGRADGDEAPAVGKRSRGQPPLNVLCDAKNALAGCPICRHWSRFRSQQLTFSTRSERSSRIGRWCDGVCGRTPQPRGHSSGEMVETPKPE